MVKLTNQTISRNSRSVSEERYLGGRTRTPITLVYIFFIL